MGERAEHDPFDFEDRMAHNTGRTTPETPPSPDNAAGTPDTAEGSIGTRGDDRTDIDAELQAMIEHDLAILEQQLAEDGIGTDGDDETDIDAELQAMIEHDLAILEQHWAEEESQRLQDGYSGSHCPFCDMLGKKSETPGFIGGIFDDEGNHIDPASIPTPGMCILCRTYDTDNWGEEILCLLTRCEAIHGDEEFRCHNFAPKFGGMLP